MSSILYVMLHLGSSVVTARLIHDRLNCAPVCGSHTPRRPRTSALRASLVRHRAVDGWDWFKLSGV